MDLIFFKSKEHANHYMIHKVNSGTNPAPLLAKLTHTGEYADSGHPHVEIEMGFVFRTDAPERFLSFLVEQIATHHIENAYYNRSIVRSWYEFKDVSTPEKWLEAFEAFDKQQQAETQKAATDGVQMPLF